MGEEARGAGAEDLGPEEGEELGARAGHPGVKDVPHDGDLLALQGAQGLEEGVGVQEGLGGVGPAPVPPLMTAPLTQRVAWWGTPALSARMT